MINMLLYAWCF